MGCNCRKNSTVKQPKVVVKPAQTRENKTVNQSRTNVASRNRKIIRRVAR